MLLFWRKHSKKFLSILLTGKHSHTHYCLPTRQQIKIFISNSPQMLKFYLKKLLNISNVSFTSYCLARKHLFIHNTNSFSSFFECSAFLIFISISSIWTFVFSLSTHKSIVDFIRIRRKYTIFICLFVQLKFLNGFVFITRHAMRAKIQILKHRDSLRPKLN